MNSLFWHVNGSTSWRIRLVICYIYAVFTVTSHERFLIGPGRCDCNIEHIKSCFWFLRQLMSYNSTITPRITLIPHQSFLPHRCVNTPYTKLTHNCSACPQRLTTVELALYRSTVTRKYVTAHSAHPYTELILGLCPTNERRRYKVTPSLIGWAQTLNHPWHITPRHQYKVSYFPKLLLGSSCVHS